MTNPFSNTTILNASQHLSNKSNISKVKTLSCQRQKCNNNKITLCNNKFKRAPGHNALLNFTKVNHIKSKLRDDFEELFI